MDKNEKAAIYKAINNVSKRVNEVSQKLDELMLILNNSANEKILINSSGIDGLADVVALHDGAIDDIANIISEMEAK